MAALRRVVSKGFFNNSLLKASKCVRIRNLALDVDDNVSGITDEQKQVSFSTILHHMVYFLVTHTTTRSCAIYSLSRKTVNTREFLECLLFRHQSDER